MNGTTDPSSSVITLHAGATEVGYFGVRTNANHVVRLTPEIDPNHVYVQGTVEQLTAFAWDLLLAVMAAGTTDDAHAVTPANAHPSARTASADDNAGITPQFRAAWYALCDDIFRAWCRGRSIDIDARPETDVLDLYAAFCSELKPEAS